ncbi:MAG: PAS domain S-box protein [Methanoregula sp.]|nr:PAS domain S-box protein [Methanoregula sp.]
MAAGKKNPEGKTSNSPGIEGFLREIAEEQLARSPPSSPDLKEQTAEELIYELQVHQIELETQAEELRRAYLALEVSRDKYLDLYDFAPLGYLTLNEKALITEVNLHGATLLGIERKKLVNAPFSKCMPKKDADEWHRYFLNVLSEKGKQTCTLMLMRGNGSPFPARLESIRFAGSNGDPSIRVAFSDITDIREAGQALRESEERYRLLLQNANDMIFIHEVNPQGPGKFLEVNDTICSTLGYSREELLSMQVSDIDVPEQQEKIPAIQNHLYSHQNTRFETEHIAKDGHRVPVEVTVALLEQRGRQTVLAIVRDISEHKYLVSALQDSNKKLNLLSSITRHDINNQLVTINGSLELLHMTVPGDPERENFFTKISTAADRITAMIQFTKEYETVGASAPVWQDCRTLVDTATKQAPLGQVVVKNDLPAGMEVLADPLLGKVCYNMMENAVRYGRKITTIRFSEEERNGVHVVVCEDNGDGVPVTDKERIFDRGFGKNTGLGLALAREILAITGITLRETGEPGNGARFEMAVPKGKWRMTRKGD